MIRAVVRKAANLGLRVQLLAGVYSAGVVSGYLVMAMLMQLPGLAWSGGRMVLSVMSRGGL